MASPLDRAAYADTPPMPPWERWLVYAMVAASLAFSLLPIDFSWDNYGTTTASLDGSLLLQVQWGSLFALSAWLLWRRANRVVPRLKELNPFLIAIILYCLISVVWSPLPVTTIKRVIQLGGLTALAIVVHDRLPHNMDFRRLVGLTMLVIMALSLVVSVLVPHIGVDPTLGNAWRGITQHKNTLGMVAAISVMLWVSGFTRMHLPIKTRLIGLLFSFFILVMAKSSTALLAAVMGVVLLVSLRKRIPRRNHLFTRIAIALAMTAMLGLFGFFLLLGRLPTWEEMFSIVGLLTGKSSDLTGRNVIWALVIEQIYQHPIIGIGYGAFWAGAGSPSDVVTHALKGWHNIYQAHNGYLDLINETGFVGLGLFIAMIITHLVTLTKLVQYDRDRALVHWTLIIFLLVSNFSESGLLRGIVAQNLLLIYLSVDASLALARYRRAAKTVANEQTALANAEGLATTPITARGARQPTAAGPRIGAHRIQPTTGASGFTWAGRRYVVAALTISAALIVSLTPATNVQAAEPASASASASAPALALRTPDGETQSFFVFDIDQDLEGAPDVSSRTGGARLSAQDQLVVSGPHFVRIGTGTPDSPNGERIRLYGINLSFAANFPTAEQGKTVARRLRALGFNAVRLHHMDTQPGQARSPNSLLTDGAFPTFNADAVALLRTFIDTLAAEGIYVDLNLRVGYTFKPALDQVPPIPSDGEIKPLQVFHPRMVALQAEFARQVIDRLGLANHPALAMVEINNESSLGYAYERGTLTRALTPPYLDELRNQWRTWLQRTQPGVSQAYANDRFSEGMALRTDEFARFLSDVDKTYLDTLRDVVRQAAGWPVAVTGTQMGYGGQHYVASHATMDYLDEHFYIDHYDFPAGDWSRTDWRILDTDATRADFQKLERAYQRRDANKPWAMSEYNMAYPNQQGSSIIPLVAGIALAGDWDALYFFDYADGKVWNQAADSFTLSGDPGKLALTGQSSVLYREGRSDWLPVNWAYDAAQPANLFKLDTPRAAGVIGRLGTNHSYRAGVLSVTLNQDARGYATTLLTPVDDADLIHSHHMLFTIAGAVRGTEPTSQPPRPKAMIKLNGKATLAPDVPAGTGIPPSDVTPGPGGPRDATGPMWMEQIPARLTLHTAVTGWTVYPLDGHGRRQGALAADAVRENDEGLHIDVHRAGTPLSAWYELVAPGTKGSK